MGDEKRRVRQKMRDAAADAFEREDMEWDNDMLVFRERESDLDEITLDERHARGMGPPWEQRRE